MSWPTGIKAGINAAECRDRIWAATEAGAATARTRPGSGSVGAGKGAAAGAKAEAGEGAGSGSEPNKSAAHTTTDDDGAMSPSLLALNWSRKRVSSGPAPC